MNTQLLHQYIYRNITQTSQFDHGCQSRTIGHLYLFDKLQELLMLFRRNRLFMKFFIQMIEAAANSRRHTLVNFLQQLGFIGA